MPVILPFSLLLGSLGSLVYLITHRFRVLRATFRIQEEFEIEQKKKNRMQKQQSHQKERALLEIQRAHEQKQHALRHLGAINELMKQVDHALSREDDELALKTLIQVLAFDEQHRKANELIVRLYLKQGQYKKAELIAKRLIDLHPFDPQYHAQMALSLFYRRQFKQAIQSYEQALNLDKNNPKRFMDLAQVFALRKDYPQALEYYGRAHRLNMRDTELMFLIVDTCLKNTDPISAREYLHKILDYEPYNERAKGLLGEVLRTLQAGTPVQH